MLKYYLYTFDCLLHLIECQSAVHKYIPCVGLMSDQWIDE